MAFFKDFGEVELWEVVRIGTWQSIDDGTVLMRENDQGDCFHPARGRGRVSLLGKRLAVLKPGSCFGEILLRQVERRTTTVTARGRIRPCRIPAGALRVATPACQVGFNKAFMRVLVRRLAQANRQLAQRRLQNEARQAEHVLGEVRDQVRRDRCHQVERLSQNLRSTSYSAAKPKPPWVWMHTFRASRDALAARCLAMFASAPQDLRESNKAAALYHEIRRPRSPCTPRRWGTGCPGSGRSAGRRPRALSSRGAGLVHEPVTIADAFAAMDALGIEPVQDVPEALAFLADQVLGRDLEVVDEHRVRFVVDHVPDRAHVEAFALGVDQEDGHAVRFLSYFRKEGSARKQDHQLRAAGAGPPSGR